MNIFWGEYIKQFFFLQAANENKFSACLVVDVSRHHETHVCYVTSDHQQKQGGFIYIFPLFRWASIACTIFYELDSVYKMRRE